MQLCAFIKHAPRVDIHSFILVPLHFTLLPCGRHLCQLNGQTAYCRGVCLYLLYSAVSAQKKCQLYWTHSTMFQGKCCLSFIGVHGKTFFRYLCSCALFLFFLVCKNIVFSLWVIFVEINQSSLSVFRLMKTRNRVLKR